MAYARGVERQALLLDPARHHVPANFDALGARRLRHEPVAYILGYRDFWTIRLTVGPGALIPRPESETLIDAAVQHFGGIGPKRVIDLGTGPGTLLYADMSEWLEGCGLRGDNRGTALGDADRNSTSRNSRS